MRARPSRLDAFVDWGARYPVLVALISLGAGFNAALYAPSWLRAALVHLLVPGIPVLTP